MIMRRTDVDLELVDRIESDIHTWLGRRVDGDLGLGVGVLARAFVTAFAIHCVRSGVKDPVENFKDNLKVLEENFPKALGQTALDEREEGTVTQ